MADTMITNGPLSISLPSAKPGDTFKITNTGMKKLTVTNMEINQIATTVRECAPHNPQVGEMYYNSKDGGQYVFDGTDWKIVGGNNWETNQLRTMLYNLDVITQDGIYVLEMYNNMDVILYEKDPPMKTAEKDELLEHINVAEGQIQVLNYLKECMGEKEYLWVEKKFFEILC